VGFCMAFCTSFRTDVFIISSMILESHSVQGTVLLFTGI
jgi:hypothetical protein